MLDVVLTDTRDVLGVLAPILYDAAVMVRSVEARKDVHGRAMVVVTVTPAPTVVYEQAMAALGQAEPDKVRMIAGLDDKVMMTWTARLPETVVTLTGVVTDAGEQ
jgi:hypothetical protein